MANQREGAIINWKKISGTLTGASAVLRPIMPGTANTVASVSKVGIEARKATRSFRGVTSQLNASQSNKNAKNAISLFNSAMNDISAGKYDVEKANNEMYDDYEAETADDFIVPSGDDIAEMSQEEIILMGNRGVAKSVIQGSSATLRGMEAMTNAIIGSNVKLTQAQTTQLNNTMLAGFNLLNTQLSMANNRLNVLHNDLQAMIEFNNTNTIKFYNKTLTVADGLGKMLENVQNYLNPELSKQRRFDFSNGFSLKAYGQYVMDGIKESMAGQVTEAFKGMLPRKGAYRAETYGGGGLLSTIMNTVIPFAMPKSLQKSFATLDKTLMRSMESGINALADKLQDGIPFFSMFGIDLRQILGNKKISRNDFNLGLYNRDAMMWNGEAQRALVEVIPNYLANIEAAVKQSERRFYDYETGQFKGETRIQKDYEEEYTRIIAGSLEETFEKLAARLEKTGVGSKQQDKIYDLFDRLIDASMQSKISDKQRDDAVARKLRTSGVDEGDIAVILQTLGYNIRDARRLENDRRERIGRGNSVQRQILNEAGREYSTISDKRHDRHYSARSQNLDIERIVSEIMREMSMTDVSVRVMASNPEVISEVTINYLSLEPKQAKQQSKLVIAKAYQEERERAERKARQDQRKQGQKVGGFWSRVGDSAADFIDKAKGKVDIYGERASRYVDAAAGRVAAAGNKFDRGEPIRSTNQPRGQRQGAGRASSFHTEHRQGRSQGADREERAADIVQSTAMVPFNKEMQMTQSNMDREQLMLTQQLGEVHGSANSDSVSGSIIQSNNALRTAVGMMTHGFQSFVARLFGKEGFITNIFGKAKTAWEKIKETLFTGENAPFKDQWEAGQKKWTEFKGKVKEQLGQGYDYVYGGAMQYLYGEDWQNNERYKNNSFLSQTLNRQWRRERKEQRKAERQARQLKEATELAEKTDPQYNILRDIRDIISHIVKGKDNTEEKVEETVEKAIENLPALPPPKSSTNQFLLPAEAESTQEKKTSSNGVTINGRFLLPGKTSTHTDEQVEETQNKLASINKSYEETAIVAAKTAEDAKALSTELVGDMDKDGKAKAQEYRKSFAERMRAIAPKATAAGIVGAGVGFLNAANFSLLGSMFLPGGPIGGAIVGAGLTILSQTEGFQKFMFGEKDKDGNRQGGLITKKLQERFKQAAPLMAGGAAIGAIRGLAKGALGFNGGLGILGMQILPGGILGGAIIGAGLGILKSNQTFNELILGKTDENGKHSGGIFSPVANAWKKIKSGSGKGVKGAAKGLAGGALTGAVLSNMGFLPAMLLPGGALGGAIAGLGIGIASASDRFNEWMFGSEYTDKDGNTHKTDGIITKVQNMLRINVIEPIGDAFKNKMLDLVDWTKDKITYPFRLAFGPIIDSLKDIRINVVDFVKEKFNVIGDGIENMIKGVLKTIFSPITRFVSFIGKSTAAITNIAAKIALSPISGSLRMLQFMTMGKRRKAYKDFAKDYFRRDDEGNSFMDRMRGYWDAKAQDNDGRRPGIFERASDLFNAVTLRGDFYNQSMAGWADGRSGDDYGGANSLDWMKARGEKRENKINSKARKAEEKKWSKIDKVRRKYARAIKYGNAELTDDAVSNITKELEDAGLEKGAVSSSEDIMKLIFNRDQFKEDLQKGISQEEKQHNSAVEFYLKGIYDWMTGKGEEAQERHEEKVEEHYIDKDERSFARRVRKRAKANEDMMGKKESKKWRRFNLRKFVDENPEVHDWAVRGISNDMLDDFFTSSLWEDYRERGDLFGYIKARGAVYNRSTNQVASEAADPTQNKQGFGDVPPVIGTPVWTKEQEDAFKFFGIKPGTSEDIQKKAKKVQRMMTKKFHPDLYYGDDPMERQSRESMMDKINGHWDTLYELFHSIPATENQPVETADTKSSVHQPEPPVATGAQSAPTDASAYYEAMRAAKKRREGKGIRGIFNKLKLATGNISDWGETLEADAGAPSSAAEVAAADASAENASWTEKIFKKVEDILPFIKQTAKSTESLDDSNEEMLKNEEKAEKERKRSTQEQIESQQATALAIRNQENALANPPEINLEMKNDGSGEAKTKKPSLLSRIWDGITGGVSKIGGFFTNNKVVGTVGKWLLRIGKTALITSLVGGLVEFIFPGITKNTANGAKGFFDNITEGLKGFNESVKENGLFGTLWNGVKGAGQKVKDAGNWVLDALGPVGVKIREGWQWFREKIDPVVTWVAEKTEPFRTWVMEKVSPVLDNFNTNIWTPFSEWVNGIGEKTKEFIPKLWSAISTMPTMILNWVSDNGDWIGDMIGRNAERYGNAVARFVTTVAPIIGDVVTKVAPAIADTAVVVGKVVVKDVIPALGKIIWGLFSGVGTGIYNWITGKSDKDENATGNGIRSATGSGASRYTNKSDSATNNYGPDNSSISDWWNGAFHPDKVVDVESEAKRSSAKIASSIGITSQYSNIANEANQYKADAQTMLGYGEAESFDDNKSEVYRSSDGKSYYQFEVAHTASGIPMVTDTEEEAYELAETYGISDGVIAQDPDSGKFILYTEKKLKSNQGVTKDGEIVGISKGNGIVQFFQRSALKGQLPNAIKAVTTIGGAIGKFGGLTSKVGGWVFKHTGLVGKALGGTAAVAGKATEVAGGAVGKMGSGLKFTTKTLTETLVNSAKVTQSGGVVTKTLLGGKGVAANSHALTALGDNKLVAALSKSPEIANTQYGIFTRLISKLDGFATKLATNGTLVAGLEKIVYKKGDKLAGKIASFFVKSIQKLKDIAIKATDKLATIIEKITAGLARISSDVLETVVFVIKLANAVIGGVFGAFDAPNLFGVTQDKCDPAMRITSAIIELLLQIPVAGVIMDLLFEIFEMFNLHFKREIAQFIYDLIAPMMGGEAGYYKQGQEALEQELNVYNALNGTNIDINSYNKDIANKKTADHLWDAISWVWGGTDRAKLASNDKAKEALSAMQKAGLNPNTMSQDQISSWLSKNGYAPKSSIGYGRISNASDVSKQIYSGFNSTSDMVQGEDTLYTSMDDEWKLVNAKIIAHLNNIYDLMLTSSKTQTSFFTSIPNVIVASAKSSAAAAYEAASASAMSTKSRTTSTYIPYSRYNTTSRSTRTTTSTSRTVGYGDPMYAQGNSAWGNMEIGRFANGRVATMKQAGCGPTALAAVANKLGVQSLPIGYGNISPAEMAQYAANNGYISDGGANAALFTQGAARMGLRSTELTSAKSLRNALASGHPAILSGTGNGNGNPYTSSGHIVAADAIYGNHVSVLDPITGRHKFYNINSLAKGTNYAWAYDNAVGYGQVMMDDGAKSYSEDYYYNKWASKSDADIEKYVNGVLKNMKLHPVNEQRAAIRLSNELNARKNAAAARKSAANARTQQRLAPLQEKTSQEHTPGYWSKLALEKDPYTGRYTFSIEELEDQYKDATGTKRNELGSAIRQRKQEEKKAKDVAEYNERYKEAVKKFAAKNRDGTYSVNDFTLRTSYINSRDTSIRANAYRAAASEALQARKVEADNKKKLSAAKIKSLRSSYNRKKTDGSGKYVFDDQALQDKINNPKATAEEKEAARQALNARPKTPIGRTLNEMKYNMQPINNTSLALASPMGTSIGPSNGTFIPLTDTQTISAATGDSSYRGFSINQLLGLYGDAMSGGKEKQKYLILAELYSRGVEPKKGSNGKYISAPINGNKTRLQANALSLATVAEDSPSFINRYVTNQVEANKLQIEAQKNFSDAALDFLGKGWNTITNFAGGLWNRYIDYQVEASNANVAASITLGNNIADTAKSALTPAEPDTGTKYARSLVDKTSVANKVSYLDTLMKDYNAGNIQDADLMRLAEVVTTTSMSPDRILLNAVLAKNGKVITPEGIEDIITEGGNYIYNGQPYASRNEIYNALKSQASDILGEQYHPEQSQIFGNSSQLAPLLQTPEEIIAAYYPLGIYNLSAGLKNNNRPKSTTEEKNKSTEDAKKASSVIMSDYDKALEEGYMWLESQPGTLKRRMIAAGYSPQVYAAGYSWAQYSQLIKNGYEWDPTTREMVSSNPNGDGDPAPSGYDGDPYGNPTQTVTETTTTNTNGIHSYEELMEYSKNVKGLGRLALVGKILRAWYNSMINGSAFYDELASLTGGSSSSTTSTSSTPDNSGSTTAFSFNGDAKNLAQELLGVSYNLVHNSEGAYNSVVANDVEGPSFGVGGFHGGEMARVLAVLSATPGVSANGRAVFQKYAKSIGNSPTRALSSSEVSELKAALTENASVVEDAERKEAYRWTYENIAIPNGNGAAKWLDDKTLKDPRSFPILAGIGQTGQAYITDRGSSVSFISNWTPVSSVSGNNEINAVENVLKNRTYWANPNPKQREYYNGWMNRITRDASSMRGYTMKHSMPSEGLVNQFKSLGFGPMDELSKDNNFTTLGDMATATLSVFAKRLSSQLGIDMDQLGLSTFSKPAPENSNSEDQTVTVTTTTSSDPNTWNGSDSNFVSSLNTKVYNNPNSRVLANRGNYITNPSDVYGGSHSGVDIVGTGSSIDDIIAHSDGTVVYIQTGQRLNRGSTGNASYGNFVKIKHNNGWYTLYAHLAYVASGIGNGTKVKRGQVIGRMGETGNAYGAHLHWEVHNANDSRVTPEPYLNANLPSSAGYGNVPSVKGDTSGSFNNGIQSPISPFRTNGAGKASSNGDFVHIATPAEIETMRGPAKETYGIGGNDNPLAGLGEYQSLKELGFGPGMKVDAGFDMSTTNGQLATIAGVLAKWYDQSTRKVMPASSGETKSQHNTFNTVNNNMVVTNSARSSAPTQNQDPYKRSMIEQHSTLSRR